MKTRSLYLLIVCIVGIVVSCFVTIASAYDNKTVHRKINESACLSQNSITNTYIIENLGYTGGIEKEFNDTSVKDWLSEGGFQEDEPFPYLRVLRHFHDPFYSAADWDQAGLFGTFDSALVWTQETSQGSPVEEENTHNWVTARNSFYNALTTGSESEFAETFLSLGQVMHMVSDMAVPAHVRYDPHLIYVDGDPYEKYTAEHTVNPDLDDFDYSTYHPVDPAIFNLAKFSVFAPDPISALWDRDVWVNSRINPVCDPNALFLPQRGRFLEDRAILERAA